MNVRIVNYIGGLSLGLVLWAACQSPRHKNADNPPQAKRIVILGNSIVAHPPNEALGWSGHWGMAASVPDSDFVHRIERRIYTQNPGAVLQYASIASYERTYWDYALEELEAYRHADVLVVKISENISTDSLAERQFSRHYAGLIRYLAPDDQTKVIICEGFWPSPVNDSIRHYAAREGYPFVPLQDLYTDDPANSAKGLFAHEGVANHPSDQGMGHIAARIWQQLSSEIN